MNLSGKLTEAACRICGNVAGNEVIIAKERQLGLGDEFEYISCYRCNCIQIRDFPDNMDRYYPPDYYSFQEAVFPSELNWFNFYLKKSLINHYMGNFDLTGYLLALLFEHPFPWIRKNEINFDSKILDVGTGSGRKLLSLQRSGFRNLTGIDPYIREDIIYKDGLRIMKRDISEIDEKYDFITLHHSFEHIADPANVIFHISRLLDKNGCALIRIPVAGSYAWKKYREFWVGLDAPRHFFLHTRLSIDFLLKDTDMFIDEIIFDSGAFQFTGSEKYLKDLLLSSPDNMFSKKELRRYNDEAKRLNREMMGDTACFYLKKRME